MEIVCLLVHSGGLLVMTREHLCANSLVRKNLQQQRMLNSAVDNVNLVDTRSESIKC